MRLSKLHTVLLLFALFGNLIFWGIYLLTGMVYEGADSSRSFIYFMMVIDLIPLFFFVRYLFSKVSKKNVGYLILVLFLFLLLLLIDSGFSLNYVLLKSYLSYSVPAVLIGVIIAKYNAGEYFTKWLEPFMLFLTAVGIRSLSWILLVSYSDLDEVGIGYQSLSYHCGFAYALNLFFLLFGNEVSTRFKYTRTLAYGCISVVLLVIQVIVSMASGGRGGFVLVVVSTLVLVLMRIKRSRGNAIKPFFSLVALFIAAVIVIQFIPDNLKKTFNLGRERTLSYITNSGIDLTETSNRDILYRQVLEDISNRPVIGYGILMKESSVEGRWPHNIVLEILLQGGLIYLLLFIIVFGFLIKKLLKLVRLGHRFIIPIALYPGVMLCFSGSYISNGLFWFVVAYIISVDLRSSFPHKKSKYIFIQSRQ